MTVTAERPVQLMVAEPKRRQKWLLPGAVAFAAVLATLVYVLWHDWAFWSIDFEVYRLGANTVLDGGPLYEVTTDRAGLFFTYTPVSALLMLPLVTLPYALMTAVWAAVELLFLQLVVWLTLDAAGVRRTSHRVLATVLVTASAVFLSAVDNDLSLGQINILLMFLVLFDLLRGDGRRWQGVCIGLAAAIKLIPLIYVVYLAVTGRVRAALTALGVFVVLAGVGFAVLPSASSAYWTGVGMDTARIGEPDNLFNQSLRGMIARLTGDTTSISVLWLVIAVVVAGAGLAAAVVLHRRGERLRSVLVAALTTLLVSPVSWEHHWVWVTPLLIMLGVRAWRRRSVWWGTLFAAALAVFYLRLLDLAMPKVTGTLDEVRDETADKLSAETAFLDWVLPNSLVIAGVILLLVLALPAYRRTATST